MPLLLHLHDTRSSSSCPTLEGRAPDTPGSSRTAIPNEGGGKGPSPGPAGTKTLSSAEAHGLVLGLSYPSLPLLLFWGHRTQ